MNYSEAVSKRVLEAILPGATLVYRSAQANGEYDFDLLYSDGTVAAVEVTAAVGQTLTETIAAVRSKKKGGSVIKAAACQKSWLIFPAEGASINTIRAAADGCLAQLEHQGIDRFSCLSTSPSVRNISPAAELFLRRLRRRYGLNSLTAVAQSGRPLRSRLAKRNRGSRTIVRSWALQQRLSVTSLSTSMQATAFHGLLLPVLRLH